MLIGGQAVLLHGEPRLTQDIDVTLGVGLDRLADLLSVTNEMDLTWCATSLGLQAGEG